MIFTQIEFLILVFVVVANLGLAYMVVKDRRHNISSTFFSLLAINLAVWAVVNYFSVNDNPQAAIFWIRLVLFFAVPQPILFFLFVYNFPHKKLVLSKKVLSLMLGAAVVVMVMTLTPYVYNSVKITSSGITPVPGQFMAIFAFFTVGWILASVYIVFSRWQKSRGMEKVQWSFISAGLVVTFIMIVIFQYFFVVILGITQLVRFAPLFTMPLVVFIGYAIIKHNLMNIKVVAAEVLSIALSFFMLIEVMSSENISAFVINFFVFVAVVVISVFLVRNVLREVRQREKLEILTTELQDANKRLTKLDEAKTEFLSITSHQLRTPLSAIKGYLSMLSDGDFGKMTKKQEEIIGVLLRNSERLIRLINIFLNISRIESGRLKINKSASDLNKLIDDITKSLTIEAEEKHIKINFRPQSLPPLKFDSDKIADVLVNLLDNAIKYTPLGGKVEIGARKIDDYVMIFVSDTGHGIPYEELDQLFEKFRRGKDINRIDTTGVGLGLYIAKRIVEGHGGNIWAESEGQDLGSVFKFTLPLVDKDIVDI